MTTAAAPDLALLPGYRLVVHRCIACGAEAKIAMPTERAVPFLTRCCARCGRGHRYPVGRC